MRTKLSLYCGIAPTFFADCPFNFTYRGHERVQHADGEGGTTGKRLGQVELSIRVIIIVIGVNKLKYSKWVGSGRAQYQGHRHRHRGQ